MNSINTNILALKSAHNLEAHYARLAISTRRLSTGLRVSSAADDAAGLAIRELMRSDVSAFYQGMRNAQDAISMLQIADGALSVIDEKLIRMKELSEQAATGTYDSTQRLLIQSEFQEMGAEIDRIANATNFNGIRLLDGSLHGDHDGSALQSTGAMKIHFGSGNDSAEDYYYVDIGGATLKDLFREAGATREVLGFDPVVEDQAIPNRGDDEGQNILALPNGNMLIMTNVHTDRSIRLFEYDASGNLVYEGNVPRHDGCDGVMQPKQALVLPDGNVAVSFRSWGDNAVGLVVYDSAWNVKSNIAIPIWGDLERQDDMAMSATSGSILAGTPVNGQIVMAITNAKGDAPLNKPTVTLGPGTSAVATTLNGRHFVVAQNGAALEGYFVDDTGSVSQAKYLCDGSDAKLATFGDSAVLVYSATDAQTGRRSSFARLINADGSVGEETQINEPDPATDNTVTDVQVMKDESGNNLAQVLVAWRNSANNGTLKAEAFAIEDGVLSTCGNGDMTFVEKIAGQGLGPSNIAVLADGSIAANWQRNLGGLDDNAFSVFNVVWGAGGVGDALSLDISTQEKAQRMLTSVSSAIVAKDKIRANLGAMINRLDNSIASLAIQSVNLQAAESRISDTDVAIEMTQFVRNQVLTQSAVAILGQANSFPQMLVRLLAG